MALQRVIYRTRALDPALVLLSGKFVGAGASAPTGVEGKGATVARTAQGRYRVTLPGSGTLDIRDAKAQIERTAGLWSTRIEDIDEANRRFDIRIQRGKDANTIGYAKDAVDGAAADVTAERGMWVAPVACTVVSVKYVPTAALTANDNDYATLRVQRRDSNGANPATVASQTTKVTGGSGDWTAFKAVALTNGAGVALAAGEHLTFDIAKAGNGVAVPSGQLVVEYTDLEDKDLTSSEVCFWTVWIKNGTAV